MAQSSRLEYDDLAGVTAAVDARRSAGQSGGPTLPCLRLARATAYPERLRC